jgi:hypothetical protein
VSVGKFRGYIRGKGNEASVAAGGKRRRWNHPLCSQAEISELLVFKFVFSISTGFNSSSVTISVKQIRCVNAGINTHRVLAIVGKPITGRQTIGKYVYPDPSATPVRRRITMAPGLAGSRR